MLVRSLVKIESAIHLYLNLLTVIGASDEVLCPFYSALSISAKWKFIRAHVNSFAMGAYTYCGCLWRFVELRFYRWVEHAKTGSSSVVSITATQIDVPSQ